ncbi:MAG TPA: hypothetical protein VKX17_26105 [Planctomycetota bacterium]|nr:hypothetical protein [Planctomycetota bacterium]
MMRFVLQAEPSSFDEECRKKGREWLATHKDYNGRPRDYWSRFEPELRTAFGTFCAYSAVRIPKGEVDHFISIESMKSTDQHHLAYEWSNYRYSDSTINKRKPRKESEHSILDPFAVQDDWFDIDLHSLQLRLADKVPEEIRGDAQFTIERLGLIDDDYVCRYRRELLDMYLDGKLTLDGLREWAPIIARAVESNPDFKR